MDFSNTTILIVEDENENIFYLQELLGLYKIDNIIAYNGKQAIETVLKNPDIDLVLMDIKLPVLDGYSATEEIKKINPKLPVIAQTAYAMTHDREKAFKAGCDDYISKPILVKDLLMILEKFLKVSR